MQPGFTPSVQLQLAAFVFPIIALVVNFAIETVDEDDSLFYRLLVGSLGMWALTPSLIVLGIAVLGTLFSVTVPSVFLYLAVSLISMAFLTSIVLMIEIFEGLDSDGLDSESNRLAIWMAGAMLLLFILLSQI